PFLTETCRHLLSYSFAQIAVLGKNVPGYLRNSHQKPNSCHKLGDRGVFLLKGIFDAENERRH
ncbi:MAG TPA: hypothetical protein VL327_00785, partial [Pyrinomonadaceae bacterium]|nr:hypothetical protein [Pyrinomonadaceae bacterium]